jgi:hypothetical protein
MSKRHADACMIVDPGACNPSGIAHSIIEACAEVRSEGGGTQGSCDDPAVRLMVYQLAWICKVTDAMSDYNESLNLCTALRG